MVDLPLAPDRIVTSTAPTSSVSRGDIQQNADLMAGALSKVADASMDIATKMAKDQAGTDLQNQKVTLNADGSVSVANPANSLIFGRAGDAYHAAVAAGTIAQHSNIISQEMNNLHEKYPTDPGEFNSAADAWKAQYLAQHGGGEIGQAISQQADQVQTQHGNAITNAAGQIDLTNQQKSIQANIADQKNTLQGLARQPGGTYTPEFKTAVARMDASYDALGSNPLFKMPQEQIDLEKKNFHSLLQGEAIVAHIDDTFTKKGKGDAQKELNEAVLQNPNLSELDRSRLYTHGMARLQYLSADAQEKIAAGKEDVTLLKTNIANGKIQPTDPVVGMAVAQALGRGDAKGAHEIYAAQLVQQQRSGSDTLPLEIQAQLLGMDKTGVVNASIPAEGRALLDHIAGPESAGRYDVIYGGNRFQGYADHPRVAVPIISGPDVGQTSSAAGRYQFLAPTWDSQKQKLGLSDFSPANQDAAAWDLAQTTYKEKTGKDLLTALKSGQSGDVLPALSGQWSSLPGGRQPAGAGGGRAVAPAANGGPGFTYQQLQQNPYLASAYVRSVAADEGSAVQAAQLVVGGVNKAIDSGLAPNPADVALAHQKAAQYPDKLGASVEAMDGRLNSEIVSQLPQPQRDALVAQYRDMSNGQDQHHMRIAAAFLDQQEKAEKRLTDLPFTEGAHRGWIPDPQPIDFSNAATVGQALAQRGAMSNRIAVMNHSAPPAALEGDELKQVKGLLATADVPAKTRILSALAVLPPDVFSATLAKLGADDTDSMVTAAAGSMMRGQNAAPDVAASILRGQQTIKTNKEFLPKGEGEAASWAEKFADRLPASMFSLGARTDATGSYAVAQGMVKARYADLSAQSSDTTGKLNNDRLTQAVNDVTGGILDHNGGKLIAPVRGMPQSAFDRTMYGLNDSDLQGVTTKNGQPVTADYLRNNATLESIGDGRYYVKLGKDPLNPIYAFTGANTESPKPFMLDLRNRPQGTVPPPTQVAMP